MATGAKVFFVIEDGSIPPQVSRIEIDFEDALLTLLADSMTLIETAWDILNPLMNGHLKSAGVTFEADISAFTNAAAAVLSDVQEKADFSFRSILGFPLHINIPTFIETLFTSAGAGDVVDTANSAVAAFIAMMTTGVTVGLNVIEPINAHGEDIDTFVEGTENWGKRRR